MDVSAQAQERFDRDVLFAEPKTSHRTTHSTVSHSANLSLLTSTPELSGEDLFHVPCQTGLSVCPSRYSLEDSPVNLTVVSLQPKHPGLTE
jgi:hypothetical protein